MAAKGEDIIPVRISAIVRFQGKERKIARNYLHTLELVFEALLLAHCKVGKARLHHPGLAGADPDFGDGPLCGCQGMLMGEWSDNPHATGFADAHISRETYLEVGS